MFRHLSFLILAAFVLSFASSFDVRAQNSGSAAEGNEGPKITRTSDSGRSDKPSGKVRLRIPLPAKEAPGSRPGKHEEEDIPVEDLPIIEKPEPSPEPDPEQKEEVPTPATFFGEALDGNAFVWTIDLSGSMNGPSSSGPVEDKDGNTLTSPTISDLIKFEFSKALKGIQDRKDAKFAVLTHGQVNGPKELVEATSQNVETEIKRIQQFGFDAMSQDDYGSLKAACQRYGDKVAKIFMIADGVVFSDSLGFMKASDPKDPNSDHAKTKKYMREEFPGWFGPLAKNGCRLNILHVYGFYKELYEYGGITQFMKEMSTLGKGAYSQIR